MGLLVEAQRAAASTAGALDERLAREAEPARTQLPAPVAPGLARRLQVVEARGVQELNRLAALGREEERRGRELIEASLQETTKRSVDAVLEITVPQIAESPEVRELIRVESKGVLEDFLEQVQSRVAEADDRLEGLVHGAGSRLRRLFRPGKQAPADLPTTNPLDPTSPAAARQGQTAGFISRLAALAIDGWAILVGIASARSVVSGVTSVVHLSVPGTYESVLEGAALAAGGLVVGGYLVFGWTVFGSTVGTALMGLQVVARSGGRVSLGAGLLRLLGYLLSALPLYLGFLWVLLDRKRLGWHDYLSGTKVVYSSIRGRRSSRPS
jgi:uncharacterized RDD family membrane protein YckC